LVNNEKLINSINKLTTLILIHWWKENYIL